jgi:predicted O-methyltransferase YrrM
MINFHFVKHFFNHYKSATPIDVLHSPFIFKLYNTCIKRQPKQVAFSTIEQLRKDALKNTTPIEQIDLGALGSKQRIRTKSVRYYAAKHAKPKRLAEILHHLIKHLQCKNCIELGTSLGFTGMYLASALPPNGKLYSMEGAPEIYRQAKQHFYKIGLNEKVELINGNFDDELPNLCNKLSAVDFAFIDGNHTYESTLQYFNTLLPLVHNNSVLVFDDIYWSKGMTQAWNEIKQHPQVTVTVDLFFIGLVFFRKEQAKQHFKLRVW